MFITYLPPANLLPSPSNHDHHPSTSSAINAALISELELDSPRPRRNSFDLAEAQQQQPLVVDSNEQAVAAAGLVVASGMTKYENQESGFTHRRYTTDSVQRDEMSKAKLQLTKQKIQQEWVGEEQPLVAPVEEQSSNNNTNKTQETATAAAADSTAMDVGDNGKDDAKSKKKRRKKSIMKKKNSQRKNSSSSSNGSAGSESTILGKDTDSSSSLPTPVASVKDTSDSSVKVVVASGSVPSAEGAEGAFKPIKPERQMRDMDMHFFSDTEVTSTTGNRNNNDILSDTEFEMSQRSSQSEAAQAGAEGQAAWKWGELPTGESAGGDERTKAVGQRKSMLTAMFSFMQQNRKGDGGLYLSDLDAEGMDPEVAALYFPCKKGTGVEEIEMELEANANGRTIKYPSGSGMEDDRESGNGTSLPHSPSSVELGSKMTMDSDLDESSRERNLECLAMSTCGGLENGLEPTADEFDKYLVTYSEVGHKGKKVCFRCSRLQLVLFYFCNCRLAAIPLYSLRPTWSCG